MIRQILTLGILSLLGVSALVAATEAEKTARQYMAAYSAVDWDAMESLMDENIHFSDPTAMGPKIEGPDGLQLSSRSETMEMLRNFGSTSGVIELGFTWDSVFESNGRVVFMGQVNALYPTQEEGQLFRWQASQVTVVTLRNGRVTKHVDFADYAHPNKGKVPVEP